MILYVMGRVDADFPSAESMSLVAMIGGRGSRVYRQTHVWCHVLAVLPDLECLTLGSVLAFVIYNCRNLADIAER